MKKICLISDQHEKIICEDHDNQTLNCSSLDAIIDIKYAKLERSVSSNKTTCRPKLNTDVSCQVSSKCQGRIWCSLSVKSIQRDQCPAERECLLVSYICVKKSVVTEAG